MKLTTTGTPNQIQPDTITDGVLLFPKYIFGAQFTTGAERHYEGWYRGYRVIAILWTRRNLGGWGTGKFTYTIDRERKVYKTQIELMNELNSRVLRITPKA